MMCITAHFMKYGKMFLSNQVYFMFAHTKDLRGWDFRLNHLLTARIVPERRYVGLAR